MIAEIMFPRQLLKDKSTTKPFTYYLSPYESSRVEKATNDNFTDLFEKSENIYDNHNNSGDEEKQITKAKD